MDDLVRWLGEQLDEDERITREALRYTNADWHLNDAGDVVLCANLNPLGGDLPVTADVWRRSMIDSPGIVPFIAEHDPARVLREIDAKRRIVEIHRVVGFEDEDMTDLGPGCSECGYSAEYGDRGGWCETLRLLAAPYADRPGYREEWRP